MELSEALNFVDSLELDEKTIDFSEFTDEQLLSISITLDLLSLDEAKAFELELAKRQLTERYINAKIRESWVILHEPSKNELWWSS